MIKIRWPTEVNKISYSTILNNLSRLFAIAGLLISFQPDSYAQTTSPDCVTGCVQITVTRISGYIKVLTPSITEPISVTPPAPTPVPQPTPTPVPVPEPIPTPVPTPAPQTLVVPVFTPQSGAVAYGSTITLAASALPDGAVLEYSSDNGSTWVQGNQFVISSRIDLIGRVRLGDQTATSDKITFTPYFQRMLVIGNSIMNHGPAPDFGWFNNNGMAASAPEKDFVHLLTGQLQTLYAGVAVKLQSSGSLERQYGMSNYSIDEFNEPVQQFKPDLILVRMGENVDDSQVQARNFETSFREFLERLVLLSGSQPIKIVCTTSVWSNPQADAVIRKITNEKGYTLVDLSSMVGQGQYFASQYANGAVAAHPNDAGMQRIDELIWEKLR